MVLLFFLWHMWKKAQPSLSVKQRSSGIKIAVTFPQECKRKGFPALPGNSHAFVTTLFIFSSDLFMIKITIYSRWGAEGKWSFLHKKYIPVYKLFPSI